MNCHRLPYLALLLGLSLAGCAGSDAGSEPAPLSSSARLGFVSYLQLDHPGAFAVAVDGSAWGASHCPDDDCKADGAAAAALTSCRRSSNGTPCEIYARGRTVVSE